MENILVTGGAGFIGSNFVKYLFRNYTDYKIIVLDALTYAGNLDNFNLLMKGNSHFNFWYGDVRNPEIVNSLVPEADYIIHFAAETHVARSIFDNKIFFETDVLGTQTICNAIVRTKNRLKKFIHISTSEVYGTAIEEPMTENHPLMPCSPYASAKAGADRLVYSYWKTYGIPAIIVRPFNNYGPYQHLEKVIPRFITSALLDEPLTVHGDGSASRDWLYVQDHCKALDIILHSDNENLFGKVINLGTGIAIDITTIAQKVLLKMGKPLDLITYIHDRPGQVTKHIASTRLAKELLGWEAETDFDKGLDLTIDWYANNPKWWEPLRWMRQVPIKLKNGTIYLH
ncbi:MAG: epimerase [Deltaproteobacteria bacterium]|nr:MAG: epimerase [Deltaproteobacteria bacterium]